MLTLVDIPHPVSRNGGKDRSFAKVVANDLGGEGEEGPIVRYLRANRIDHCHALPSDAVGQTGNAQNGIAAKNHRIQPLVGYTRVDDVHFAQTGDGFEINLIIQNEEIPALDQRYAHSSGEKAMLRVGWADRSRGEENDHRIRFL